MVKYHTNTISTPKRLNWNRMFKFVARDQLSGCLDWLVCWRSMQSKLLLSSIIGSLHGLLILLSALGNTDVHVICSEKFWQSNFLMICKIPVDGAYLISCLFKLSYLIDYEKLQPIRFHNKWREKKITLNRGGYGIGWRPCTLGALGFFCLWHARKPSRVGSARVPSPRGGKVLKTSNLASKGRW